MARDLIIKISIIAIQNPVVTLMTLYTIAYYAGDHKGFLQDLPNR